MGHIIRLKNVACKLAQSLMEIIQAVQVLDELQQSMPNRLISAMQTVAMDVSSSRDRLTCLVFEIENHHSSTTLLEGVSCSCI